jgi:hypothetical protein
MLDRATKQPVKSENNFPVILMLPTEKFWVCGSCGLSRLLREACKHVFVGHWVNAKNVGGYVLGFGRMLVLAWLRCNSA